MIEEKGIKKESIWGVAEVYGRMPYSELGRDTNNSPKT